ncbi:hypothetical protein DYB36_006977, partial [Aphanomyces astaci]
GSGLVPAGTNCPVKGDKAVASCFPHLKTYSNRTCTAGINSVCRKIPSGAWGCVWNVTVPTGTTWKPTSVVPTTTKATTPNATTAKPVTTTAAKPTTTARRFDVSVVGDATYNIAGPICSGSGLVPAGTKCPVKGDKAVASCHKGLKTFANSTCVAPVNSVCQKIPSGAWGCVWNSTATNATIVKPTTTGTIVKPTTTKATTTTAKPTTTAAVTTKKP